MASTGIDKSGMGGFGETVTVDAEKNAPPVYRRNSGAVSVKTVRDSTHRQLKPRHIQLIGIGGTIGTALYVQIGKGLMNGGPASLFLAFSLWYVLILWDCVGLLVVFVHCAETMRKGKLTVGIGALSSSPLLYVSLFLPRCDMPERNMASAAECPMHHIPCNRTNS